MKGILNEIYVKKLYGPGNMLENKSRCEINAFSQWYILINDYLSL
jgi:hypothetical protein